jgi:bifunctional DNA-binding transcriptional regulator/antitoxin component of YhaV-PrlF toxin-antitoxin module
MQKEAGITSKGQITVPREIRRVLGVRSGDKLYRGIGNSAIPAGRKGIAKWLRRMRGQ